MRIRNRLFAFILVVSTISVDLYGQTDSSASSSDSPHVGPLIPTYETMATAWDYPRNPMIDSLPPNPQTAAQIKRGFKIFMDTPHEAARLSSNFVSCNNCHLNGGQREKALALVGVSGMYPEYNKRAGRLITLEDRIIECFMRSSNAAAKLATSRKDPETHDLIVSHADEVLALSSYISWLSTGYPVGEQVPWRGQNLISPGNQLAIEKLDVKLGSRLYMENCVTCHGKDGQGVQIGDKKAGPLWGPKSWNDGAGAARVYTLAGIIRYMMPYLDPGSLTDEEAQHIAAYINSKPRPKYPYKDLDYRKEKLPKDAVYYRHK